jgi:hypothetical protein
LLLTECQRWSELAIAALDDTARGGVEEMRLQACLGVSAMFTRGAVRSAREALVRSPASADEHADRVAACAEANYLAPDLSVARGFEGELAVRRGDASGGVERLRRCLEELHATPYEMRTTGFNIALAQGLAATGRTAEAVGLVDGTIRLVEANGDLCYMPELLRAKGRLLLSAGEGRGGEFHAVAPGEPAASHAIVGAAHRHRPGDRAGVSGAE